MKDDEIAWGVVEGAFALHREMGSGLLGNWMIKGQLSDPFHDHPHACAFP